MRASLVFLLAICAVTVCAQYRGDDYRRDSREYYKYNGRDDHSIESKEYHRKKYDSDEDDDSKEKYRKVDSDEQHSDERDTDEVHSDENDSDEYKKNKYYKKYDSHEKYYKKYDDSREKYYKKDRYDNAEKYYKKGKYDDTDEVHSVEDDDDDDTDEVSHDYDDAVYFQKRKLQFHDEKQEEDGFFDDVKAYYQRENYVPNYREEYKRFNKDDRRRDDSDERRYNKQRYYKERYYEIEKPNVEKEKYLQARDEKEFRQTQPAVAGETRYNWKNDRERWTPLKPLELPPPEKPYKDFVPSGDSPQPPPPSEAAKMARYIVHHSDWMTVATISTLRRIRDYPFVNVLSVSDGPEGQGSGIPYLYLTDLDFTPHDLASDRRCSVSMSLAETDYCKQQKLDPEDPRCAHLTITGEMYKLRNGTQAAKKAEEALFSRHPVMKTWPKDHNFYFATLKMEQIVLLDYFGGPKYIDVKDYLRVPSTP